MPFQLETEDGSIIELEGDQQPSEQEIDEILGGARPKPAPRGGIGTPWGVFPEPSQATRVAPKPAIAPPVTPVTLEGQHVLPVEPPSPPEFEKPLMITEEGPVYESALQAKRYGTIGAPEPTEAEAITGIPQPVLNKLRVSPPGRALFGLTEAEREAGIPSAAQPSLMEVGWPALMVGGGGAASQLGKGLSTGLGAAFAADFVRQSPAAWTAFHDAVKRGDWATAKDIAIEWGFGAAMTALNLKGLHEQFKTWDRVAGNAESAFQQEQPGKEAPAEAAVDFEARRKARISRIKSEGPTPEDMVLFTGVDPATAGTSPEAVEALASELGISWTRPAPAAPAEPAVEPAPPTAPAAEAPAAAVTPAQATPAPLAPAEIGVQLGAKHIGTAMGFDHYEFPTIKTEAGMNMDRVQVPAGSSMEVVKAAIEKRKAQVAKDFAGEGVVPDVALPGAEDIFKATPDQLKGILGTRGAQGDKLTAKLASEMTEEQLKRAEPIIAQYLQKQADDKKLLDDGQITPQEYINRVMAPGTHGKVFYDVFARLNRPIPTLPEAQKPTVTPKAPEVPAAPTELHPDVSAALNVPVVDVSEAKARNKLLTQRQDEIRKEYGTIDQRIKELEKVILNTRGRARGRIKSTAKKSDIALYRDLKAKRGELRTQITTIDEMGRKDRDAIEKAQDAAIINDPNQPLIRRLDRAYRQSGGNNPELAKALSAETYRLIREKYPDATDTELERMAPQLQRAAYFGGDFWKDPNIPTIQYLREQAISAIIGHPDSMPFQQLPDTLKDKINRYTKHFRPFETTPKPVEEISASELEALRKEVFAESENIRKEIASKEAAAKKAEEEAAAVEEKLLVEAQAVADSAGKPGAPGGRSAKDVRDELVARVKGVIDKVIAFDKTNIQQKEGDYIAAGASGSAAIGEISPTDKGRFKVSARNVSSKETQISLTVDSMEEAQWVIKALASRGAGKSVIGVPGDGVFRLHNDGPTLIHVWQSARGIDVSKGRKGPFVSRGGTEAPPKEIRTADQWREAKEYHDLRPSDRIFDWSPALSKFASQISPEHPDWVTTDYADKWVEARTKKEEPPAIFEPPKEKAAPAKPAEKPAEAPKAPEAPTPAGPLIPKERADAIRERLKKKLAEQAPGEEMALEDVSELERRKALKARLEAAIKRATPEEIAIVQPLIDQMREVEARIKELESRRQPDITLEDIEDIGALEAKSPAERKLGEDIFNDAVHLGSYYIQSGLHKFEPWAAQMRADFGEAIEPYLRSVYETARRTIEAPSGEPGSNLRAPGLQPGLLPPEARIVSDPSRKIPEPDRTLIPQELIPHLNEHQQVGAAINIKSMEERRGALNSDGTGTGKTRTGLTVAYYWAKKGFKVIYATKAEAIKPDWKKNTFGGSLRNDSQTMGIKIRLAKDAVVKPGEIGVTTYENASAIERQADSNTVIIWDECHALKNNSQRGRSGDRANNKAHAVLFMSATPADKPEHIYYLQRIGIMEGKTTAEQLRALGMVEVEMPYVDRKTGERKKHKVWVKNQNISDTERDARFSALFGRMSEQGAMIKREISMQGVHVQVLKVALPPEAHDLQQEILRFFDADTIDDLKGLNKALALMNMRRQQEPFKIAPTVLLTQKELAAGRQVMIFVSRVNESDVGRWIKVLGPGGETERIRKVLMSSEGTAKSLRDALHEAGIHDIAEIHGEADQPGLIALDDFNAGKKRVCIATIESGGTGINADDTIGNRPRSMIVVTAPFDAVGNVQAAGREWRLKTMSGVNIFYLFGDTAVDDWNADIIGSKMSTLGAVVEGQVRRLDISNPDAVTTDDFKGVVSGKAAPAPGVPVALPALEWKPFTTKSGKILFVAPATDAFWKWYNANGKNQNPLGLRVGKYQDKWQVWAEKQPGTEAPPSPAPPSAAAPEVGPGDETALEARHGTATGLPPGVPDGGPDFARELMAASHRLGTAVRSRATLRPGVLGQYVPARAAIARDDKIEVGDIRNQATVSHEMGHDIDALLFPATWAKGHTHFYSQESLKERIGFTGSKKVLFNELVAVSEVMRGPIGAGTSGHQRYRRRAAELIADWFSLYVHDPARARAMAPEWTLGFDKVLVTNREAAVTIAQLHARTVTPVSPTPGAPPVGGVTGMPGGVPPRTEPVIVRERAAALAAEQLHQGEVRRLEAEVQRARIRSEKWRNDVPNQQDRNDVGSFIEGIGNLELPGDTRDDVIKRMTPAKNKLAKEYSFQIELERQRVNAYLHAFEPGEYLKYLEDYLPHFYANAKTRAGKEAVARFIKNSPNAKQRKIPTLREAVDYGLIPLTQDPAVLAEIHADINWRVATNRRFLAQLKTITTAAGGPVIVPASQNPGGWVVSTNPLIARTYAHMTPSGLMLWKGGAAVHPDVWHAVRQILEIPVRSDLGKAYDAVNAMARANAFAFSFFHDITLTSASLGAEARLYNPLRGLIRLFEHDPITGGLKIFQGTRATGQRMLSNEEIVFDAALHGLKFAWTDSETYQHAARDFLERQAVLLRNIPVLGRSVRIARDLQASRQRNLWRNTHDALKIAAYHDLAGKALADAPPGTNPAEVKKRIASLLNDCFGGQEWVTKYWMSPQVRLAYSRFWLAPDWTLSTLRSVPFLSDVASSTTGAIEKVTGAGPIHTPKEGWKGNIGRARFWTAELAALALATIAAQWAIFQAFGRKEKGDKPWIWDNEYGQNRRIDVTPFMRQMPWRNPDDPTRYYVNLGKRPEEILTWFSEPFKNIQSKLARPLVESMKQVLGSEGEFEARWRREHESFAESIPERAKSVAENVLLPFTFTGTQFALSLPYRKGMSRYKAQQAFESAYEVLAEPNQFSQFRKAFLRGHFTSNMEGVLNDIRDAALRNGVDADQVEKRAIGEVRSRHYSRYFKAFQSGNIKAIEREVDALDRLGATPAQMEKSLERREAMQPGM